MLRMVAADAALIGSQSPTEGFRDQTGPFVLVKGEEMIQSLQSLSQVLPLTLQNIVLPYLHIKRSRIRWLYPGVRRTRTRIAVLKAEVSSSAFYAYVSSVSGVMSRATVCLSQIPPSLNMSLFFVFIMCLCFGCSMRVFFVFF